MMCVFVVFTADISEVDADGSHLRHRPLGLPGARALSIITTSMTDGHSIRNFCVCDWTRLVGYQA
jgi:hypothetical protein